jgi:hypothetical protein
MCGLPIGFKKIIVRCLVCLLTFRQIIIFGNNCFYEPYVYLVVMQDLSP